MATHIPTYTSPDGTFYIAGGQNANCTVSVCPVELSIYGYRPSLPASSLFIALFAIALLIQAALGFRYKTWWFMGSMIAGCIDEIIGYIGRIMLYENPWNHSGFIMQIVTITIGPVFFSAALYVLLSVVINNIEPKLSRFSPKIFYYIFISCDVISLILQAAGGAMSATTTGNPQTGVNIALAGLSFQVVTLCAFSGFIIDYTIRSRSVWSTTGLTRRFKVFAVACALATVLILIRCCYRVYELNDGYQKSSKALRDQSLFIGLESVMIVAAAYAMIFAHPGPAFKSRHGLNKSVAGHEKVVDAGKESDSSDSNDV